jgi:hypothetical protein
MNPFATNQTGTQVEDNKELLRQAVADKPEVYLKELAEQFGCTATAGFYALEKIDIARKKDLYLLRKIRGTAGRVCRKSSESPPQQTGICR